MLGFFYFIFIFNVFWKPQERNSKFLVRDIIAELRRRPQGGAEGLAGQDEFVWHEYVLARPTSVSKPCGQARAAWARRLQRSGKSQPWPQEHVGSFLGCLSHGGGPRAVQRGGFCSI